MNQKTKKFLLASVKPVMLKECKVVIEDLLCDTQERNHFRNEDQNNLNKDMNLLPKTLKKLVK